MTLSGRCACDAVRFTVSALPMCVHCCHCTRCQRETGSAFVLNALVERDRIDVDEPLTESITVPTDSGKGQRIVRCRTCHTALFSHYAYGAIADLLAFVRVGVLDEARAIAPTVHIFTASKQPWIVLPAGVPSFERFYKADGVWPPESLERRRALFARVA